MPAHLDGTARAGPAQPAGTARTTIRHDASLAWLHRLRADLRTWLDAAGVEPLTIDDVVLATSEAAANVVEHGYGGAGGPIVLELAVHPDRVEVQIDDDGRWRAGPSAPDRGRGLEIIGHVSVDEPSVSTSEGGTTIAFVVQRDPAG